MKRNGGDTATDPQTGWTWVCLGDRGPDLGAIWSVYGDRGQQYSALEWPGTNVTQAHSSLVRALAAGVQNKTQRLLDLVSAHLRARGDFWAGDDLRIWYDHSRNHYCIGKLMDCITQDPECSSSELVDVLIWGKLL